MAPEHEGSTNVPRTKSSFTKNDYGAYRCRNTGASRRSEILIIGATGGTGRILLDKALEQGHQVTALARNPSAVAPRDYRPRVLRGNALDPKAVGAVVAGHDAVLPVLGTRGRQPTTLFSASTANLVDAMK